MIYDALYCFLLVFLNCSELLILVDMPHSKPCNNPPSTWSAALWYEVEVDINCCHDGWLLLRNHKHTYTCQIAVHAIMLSEDEDKRTSHHAYVAVNFKRIVSSIYMHQKLSWGLHLHCHQSMTICVWIVYKLVPVNHLSFVQWWNTDKEFQESTVLHPRWLHCATLLQCLFWHISSSNNNTWYQVDTCHCWCNCCSFKLPVLL